MTSLRLGAVLLAFTTVFGAPQVAEAQRPGPDDPQRVIRYQYQGRSSFGRVDGSTIYELPGPDIFSAAVNAPTGRTVPLEGVRVLQPLQAELVEKVIGVARNTARPGRGAPVRNPRFFALFPSSLNRHQGDVEVPTGGSNFTYAGGVAVIIGRGGKNIPVGEAPDYVWGVTAAAQYYEATWASERRGDADPSALLARASDGWASLGPVVAVNVDWRNLQIETRLNGTPVQSGSSADLVNDIPDLISRISQMVTLQPGDIIFTGSVPYLDGVTRTLEPGDMVAVEVEGVGTLENQMVPMGR